MPDALALFWPAQMWRQRAACIGRGEVMFGADVAAAKAICVACPVRGECLHLALDAEVSDGVWGGLTWEERILRCPVCGWPKPADRLACSGAHDLLRLARLIELEEVDGALDVAVSLRQEPSARTYAYCPVARGRAHNTARAYKEGCRCPAARRELIAERRERRRGAS